MQTKEYIVALKDGVNYDQFWSDMEDVTSGLPHIPDRAISITNNRTAFKRICEYELTDTEAERVRNDPRVAGVEIPVKNNPLVSIVHNTTQNNNSFNKTTASYGGEVNWGLVRHSRNTNVYGAGTTTTEKYNYVLDGTGVDVVINDSGLQSDHPEFAGRISSVNWTSFYSGYVGNSYQDIDGHGTHVASIAAGKTYGWAKGATVIPLAYTDSNPAPTNDPLDCFEALINWHNSKGGSKPTVVNMSWGFSINVSDFLSYVTGGVYRGSAWTGIPPGGFNGIGIIWLDNPIQTYPYYSPSYNVALGEVIDAGITVVQAAGNEGSKVDVIGGVDYNNYLSSSFIPGYIAYYHRGFSPSDPRVIMVGNLDSETENGIDKRSVRYRSNAGPRVDIWAAGTGILAATSNTNVYNGMPYNHGNPAFKQVNISGTSMASPQIAGMCALYLQINPTATPSQVKNWIKNNAVENTLYSTGLNNDYTNPKSLLGGPNRIAYQPIQGLTRVKDATGAWKNVADVKVKTATNTWSNVKTIWTKTISGWRQTY